MISGPESGTSSIGSVYRLSCVILNDQEHNKERQNRTGPQSERTQVEDVIDAQSAKPIRIAVRQGISIFTVATDCHGELCRNSLGRSRHQEIASLIILFISMHVALQVNAQPYIFRYAG